MKEKLDMLAFIKIKIFVQQMMLFKENEKTTYSKYFLFEDGRYADGTTLMAESEEELKCLLSERGE